MFDCVEDPSKGRVYRNADLHYIAALLNLGDDAVILNVLASQAEQHHCAEGQ